MFEQACCWMNGSVIPASEARISVFDHGFLYGDGVFEGIRFYNNRVFRLSSHLRRLLDSAKVLQLSVPLSMAELEQAVAATVKASPLSDGYLRLLVTRGIGPLGINPATCPQPEVIILADQLQMIGEAQRIQGIRVMIASTRRPSPDRLDPRIKSLNYLNSIMARMEANHAGVEEAILLNDRGCVAEGTADNVFILREGTLLTPWVTEGALAGITRSVVLELAVALGITVQETVLTPYDLYTADECFLTGTGAELIPVRDVDGRELRYCPGKDYQRLSEAFAGLVMRETGAIG
ncbi:MAG TPA: branched-chain-amino-acid transaminase [Gammaproteobacteria bacterium]|nr:branched-chain-amino-acid transaminase [Gammaproteobacteria bacterium]